MNEQEIDLMDELYFVQSYEEVKSAMEWEDSTLCSHLFALYQKDYIKLLASHDTEYHGEVNEQSTIPWSDLYFLATKKGLLEHNGF